MPKTLHTDRNGIAMIFGPTEHEIMQIMWQLRSASVRQVYEAILACRPVAYTTIGTTMTRLAHKGYLSTRQIRRRGQPLMYRALRSQQDIEAQIVADTLNVLQRDYPQHVSAWLAKYVA